MDWTTHQVFNQFPELGDYDPLASDPALCEALARTLEERTGRPVTHTQAVTVLVSPGPGLPAGVGALSDAASKPVFIAGPKEWRAQAARFGLTQVLRVDQNGAIEVTRPLAARLQWVPGADGKTLPAHTEVDLPGAGKPPAAATN